MPQALKLVEYDDQSLGQGPQSEQLRVQGLGVLLGLDAGASYRALDELDVEADLLLQHADLSLSCSPQMLDRMAGHRVVHASDESRDAHDALQVDLHDIERWRVVAVSLNELERELIGERRLPGIPGPEQRDVRLGLQSQRDLVRKRFHPDDL